MIDYLTIPLSNKEKTINDIKGFIYTICYSKKREAYKNIQHMKLDKSFAKTGKNKEIKRDKAHIYCSSLYQRCIL